MNTALSAVLQRIKAAEYRGEPCQLSSDEVELLYEHITAAPASAAEARMKELELFLGEVAGTCLGVAMSGRDHPNPDDALMGLFEKAQALSAPDLQSPKA